jgi:transposase
MRQRAAGSPFSLECIEPNAAGIDVGATELYVAVAPGRDPEPVRRFQAFTEDLRAMAAWLAHLGIVSVAMESTGVYWIPAYEILEQAGLRVCLVNSKHVKHVPGRKSDVSDCQWLQYLHSVGLLRGSFRPDSAICALRSLARHRAGLVDMAAQHMQHMHKALAQMNLHIQNVLSDLGGLSGMAILDAILAGQRDPARLAALCHNGVRATPETLRKSLTGHFRQEHLFTLRQSLQAYRHYRTMVAECDAEIERHMRDLPPGARPQQDPPPHFTRKPNRTARKNQFHFDMRSELHRVFGCDLTAVPGIHALTAHTLLSEIGPNLARFPTAGAFVSWLGLCPGTHKSGGRTLSSKTRATTNRAATALRLAARALHREKSYLGGFYRRMRARLGAPQAITATAHKLARIVYRLLTTGQDYDESVFHQEETKHAIRFQRRLQKQAQTLGFQLVPIPA